MLRHVYLHLREGNNTGVSGGVSVCAVAVAAHKRQVVAAAEARLEEEARAAAAQLPLRDDRDAVAQNVRLVHEVLRRTEGN